jgi:hypothetical protein
MALLKIRPRHAALLAFAALLFTAPSAAQARVGLCAGEPLAQVFLPWADPSWYASVPDGGLEGGGAGWALLGDAAVVDANESYYVRSPDDSQALALPGGASATSPATCVGPGRPTLRFFARASNAQRAWLAVSVEFVDPTGQRRSVPIGVVSGTSSWQPSPPLPVVANTLALLGPQQAAFRFTPTGDGRWFVDDVYVDPYGKG